MRYYISGPITGTPDHRRRFLAAECAVRLEGSLSVNPLNVKPCPDESCVETPGNPRSNGHTWGCWLRYDLIEMLACDGVATIPGWERSQGAILEVTTALRVGMPVRHLTELDMAEGSVYLDGGTA